MEYKWILLWFKRISIFGSGNHVVQPSWTIWLILVEGNMRTISVKLFWFWTSGSGDFIWRYFLSRALAAPFSAEQNHLCNFGRGHHEEDFCELILNLDQMSFKDISHLDKWFRRRCHLKKKFTDGGRTMHRAKTGHNSSPWAFGSGQLII